MAENKFIKHLKGEQAVGSLVEIKNQNTPASFGNMPQGTSDSNVKYSDVRGDVTVVANGTTAWKLNDSALTLAPIVNGDGTDYTGKYEVSGAGLWVNSTYTFPSTGDPNHPIAMIFNPNSKWVLKLCGDNLIVNNGETLELTVVITIGSSNIISKQFTIREQANQFCKELVIDFDESNASMIKASGLATLQLQVLCGTANASARIYNGMSTLTVLQRKVDASVVSGSFANVEEVMRDGLLPNDYFSNAAYIAQIEDGDSAYAVFTRDGDTVALSGWAQPIPDQTNNAGKFLTTDGSLMSWEELTISNVSGLQDELDDLQDQITINKGTMDTHIADTNNPHQVTKAQVGLGNVDNTSDLNKPISTATQNALNLKADKTTTYTKTETDTLLSGKQDNISDLAAIRSNAQAGKAASDTIATYGNIVTHNVSEFATAAQGAKADTAVQPADLATVATTGSYNDLTDTPVIPSISNRVNGAPLSNSASVFYGTSSTAAATVEKVVSIPSITTLDVGTVIVVQPTVTSTVANSTIKLNNFAAYQMRYNNAAITTSTDSIVWNAAYPSVWVFDGTYWYFVAHGIDTNTTYGSMSVSEGTTGTATSNRVVRADYLKQIIQGTTLTGIDVATTGAVTATDTITDGIGKLQATKANIADLATVATSGSYNDLSNKPTIPTVNNSTITITQGGVTKGLFTLNQATGDTIDLDAGGSGSYHPDLFDHKWADHILNDVQWLRADTYSWQSGAVYQAAYAHLVDDIDGKTLQSETVAGTTIQFYLADDGHKICPASEESNVSAIYNATGVAWYYIIDTANTRFKLPRRHSQKIVRSVKNADGSWYRLYADGWVEQGGRLTQTGTATLPVQMLDANYDLQVRLDYNSTGTIQGRYWYATKTTTDFTMGVFQTTIPIDWQVSGQSTIDMTSFQNGEKYLYFYVGNFTQTALENTAGLNAELFNGKADLNLANVLANIDFVVESQEPTAGNGYTWYRKYRSGWVEQGGETTNSANSVVLPVEMADNHYVIVRNFEGVGTQSQYPMWVAGYTSKTTTGFTFNVYAPVNVWYVCGKAA